MLLTRSVAVNESDCACVRLVQGGIVTDQKAAEVAHIRFSLLPQRKHSRLQTLQQEGDGLRAA